MLYYVAAIVLIAFIFDFINGFHDSANSIATIVGTRVLSPLAAVIWAAMWNFAAAFTAGNIVYLAYVQYLDPVPYPSLADIARRLDELSRAVRRITLYLVPSDFAG